MGQDICGGDAYGALAPIYDRLMEDTPYNEWLSWIFWSLASRGIKDGLVLDLCCGTGNLTERLALIGYDVIGVDASAEMLSVASEKKEASGLDILYLQQDMRELELYGTVRAAVCMCDSLNYLETEADIGNVFRRVCNYLDPGGLFLFDCKMPYCLRETMGDTVVAKHGDGYSLIWENHANQDGSHNSYDLTCFVQGADNRYDKIQETHNIYAYPLVTYVEMLSEAGFSYWLILDADGRRLPRRETERLLVLAQK